MNSCSSVIRIMVGNVYRRIECINCLKLATPDVSCTLQGTDLLWSSVCLGGTCMCICTSPDVLGHKGCECVN